MRALNEASLAWLDTAIDEAGDWRGSRHPDDYDEFDKRIAKMRAVLAEVREQQSGIRAMNRNIRIMKDLLK